MNSLVAIGIKYYPHSLVTTFAPDAANEARHVYYEAAVIADPARRFEARAKGRTGAAIKKLAGLQAKTARVERDGQTLDIAASDVVVAAMSW